MASEQIQDGLTAVEEMLLAIVDSDIKTLHDASVHILTSGGKRIRPQVALLSYLAAGGEDLTEVVPMASAVEMVHTATLVHDDINDHSLTRRGKATVHSVWGRTFALLTGDYLFTKVYELMAPYDPEYNMIMSEATTRLVEGETLQAFAAKQGAIDRETYKRIIALKTASLFEAAAHMGTKLATSDENMIAALSSYAYNLGLTFQIVDDILDVVGNPEDLGKPVGNDLVQGRGVLAVNNGLGASEGDGKGATVAETAVRESSDPIDQMMASLRDSGALDLARMQAVESGRRARSALETVPPSPARTELYNLVDMVLDRQN